MNLEDLLDNMDDEHRAAAEEILGEARAQASAKEDKELTDKQKFGKALLEIAARHPVIKPNESNGN